MAPDDDPIAPNIHGPDAMQFRGRDPVVGRVIKIAGLTVSKGRRPLVGS
jgi:hypothetical protein